MAQPVLNAREDESLDAGVRELATVLGRVIHNLKQRGAPPPEAVQAAFDEGLLGPRHMPVVVSVALEGPMSVSEIAERIGLSVATTSLLVGELSRAAFVERAEDDRDRRRTIVSLGDEHGDALTTWTHEIVVEPLRSTLERLAPRARANFFEALRILAEESEVGGPRGEDVDCAD